MPRYDFKCTKCDLIEERTCKINERDNQICSCNSSSKMIQQFSMPNILGMDSQGSSGNKEVPFEDFDADSII